MASLPQPPSKGSAERARRERARLAAHRGAATWGEKLVPLAAFRDATARAGVRLAAGERAAALAAYRRRQYDPTPVEGPYGRVAVFGGVYSNHHALAALLDDARRRGAEAIYCLGDLGGFGPHPEKVWPLLRDGGVQSIQGNYEQSLAAGREDCNCGYTDPRDNHFAAISYDYTARNSSPGLKAWMGTLPARRRVRVGERELLLVHGSPRRVNQFLFDSTSPDLFVEVLLDQGGCDGLLCTHTGLHWQRRLPSGRDVVNVGVIGRPANDGRPNVWYALLTARRGDLIVELLPLDYDHPALAAEILAAGLPAEFAETILSGWWTTCLEILPARERAQSRF
ncbi:MAG TPA: metallophosphoesterase [Thermoanaerobaculia bacterium]|nr:metallophosphoesterase [Thermoanaerobaculia bacterium]